MSAVAALLATTVVEVVVLLLLLVPRGVGAARVALAGVVANVVTHPPLWAFVERADSATTYVAAVVAGEAVVCIVEWLILWAFLHGEDVAAADLAGVTVLANAVTTAIGLAIAVAT